MPDNTDSNDTIGTDHKFSSVEEVLNKFSAVEGKTFREIDKTMRSRNSKNKGRLGQIVEESVLGYKINSDKNPDIVAGGVPYELKVTPLKHIKNGKVSAKERLVIDIINYMEIVNEKFDTSTCWNKAQRMFVVYYYDDRTDPKKQPITDCHLEHCNLMEFSEEDLRIIRDDWQKIHDKIASGHADMLSESDTSYLAACTKGASSKTLRQAPAPEGAPSPTIQAKQRAFSLKSSYMTATIRRLLAQSNAQVQNEQPERLALTAEQTLNSYVSSHMKPFIGMPVRDVAAKLGIAATQHAKAFNSQVALKMLGIRGKNVSDVEQFDKANVTQLKTTLIYADGLPKEHMSFPAINAEQWNEIANPSVEWEDSFIYHFFEENTFLITVLGIDSLPKNHPDKMNATIRGGFLWNMPERDIENYVHPVWQKLHDTLVAHQSFHYYGTNKGLPGPSFNNVCHIRPHARDKNDTIVLPNGDEIPKQSFWLDRQYIGKIIRENTTEFDNTQR